jgi:hypothetical protein
MKRKLNATRVVLLVSMFRPPPKTWNGFVVTIPALHICGKRKRDSSIESPLGVSAFCNISIERSRTTVMHFYNNNYNYIYLG